MTHVLMFLFCLVVICYSFIIISITAGWFRKSKAEIMLTDGPKSVSIIVACRNEGRNMARLLNRLTDQYTDGMISSIQVVIVDDGSTDRTRELIKPYLKNPAIVLISLREEVPDSKGKKAALLKGAEMATGDLVLFTDADCLPDMGWALALTRSWLQSGGRCSMILGPVLPPGPVSIMQKIEYIELAVLAGVTAGSALGGKPLMCNGANYLIDRQSLSMVKEVWSDNRYSSGDDMFLLQRVKKLFGSRSIGFCSSATALVVTEPVSGFSNFVAQRLRWVSKSPGYTDSWIVFTSLTVYLMHSMLLFGVILSVCKMDWLPWLTWGFIMKVVVDLPLVYSVLKVFQQRRLLVYFLPLELAGIIYISLAGLIGISLKGNWKGRRL